MGRNGRATWLAVALLGGCGDLVVAPPQEDSGLDGDGTTGSISTSVTIADASGVDAGPDTSTSTTATSSSTSPTTTVGSADESSSTDGDASTDGGSTTTSAPGSESTGDASTGTDGTTSEGTSTSGGMSSSEATTGSSTSDGTSSDGTSSDGTTSDGTTSDGTTSDGTTSDGTTSDGGSSSDDGSTGGAPITGLPYHETFTLRDGAAWPAPWMISGDGVLLADVQGERGRLQGETGTTSRVVHTEIDALDFDAVVTVRFESYDIQGAGFYVRQNGGTLQDTEPPGQGYAVFVEGGYLGLLGLWREVDGVEEVIAAAPAPVTILDGVEYRMRLQVEQDDGFTWLRTRMWAAGDPEPVGWDVETTDATPELQDVRGGIGADVYEYESTPFLWFDDIAVTGS